RRQVQLFTVSADGGLPEKLPVPYGANGAISEDGRWLAYTPHSRDHRTWKRYRGGMAPDIWLFDLETKTSQNLTQNDANDTQPMWYGRTLYFLSDRDESMRHNIWALELDSGELRQVTRFEKFDTRYPAIGPSDIVFENAGRLYRLELPSEKLQEVEIEVVTDRSTLKPRSAKVAELIANGTVSPSGKRVVFEARGELFSLPAEHGPVVNLTRTSGIAERYPAWSPDGKTLAYFSDESGEYELWLRPADGSGEATKVTALGSGFRYNIFWSPDSKKVVFIDQAMRINLCDTESGEVTEIDQALYHFEGNLRGFTPSWSSDSRWIAYSREVGRPVSAVFLYDTTTGERHQVTAGFYDVNSPVFDPDGKYLYVLTDQTLQPSYSDFDNSWVYANATTIAAIPLRSDVASPLGPRNDVEKGEDGGDSEKESAEEEAENDEEGEDDEAEEKPEPVEIDIEGFEQRLVQLPAEAGNYNNLAASSGKVLYRRIPRTGAAGGESSVVYFDFEEREEKTVFEPCGGFAVSADGNKLLVESDNKFAIIDIKPDQKLEKPLRTGEMKTLVDPVAEWRQIFTDAWRLERDMFYDPDMHGVDWDEMRERYGALLDDVVTRWDLNFVLGELIAELSSSHSYRGGGDAEEPAQARTGLLGADFAIEQGAYRIVKILDGAPWDSEVRSPLKQPGITVNEGDWLLAVNGVPLDVKKDPWAAFEGLAGVTVELTVNEQPSLEESRKVLVETLADEYRLRNLAWINEKRLRVAEATGGRVGYVYVPDTGRNGQAELARQFYGQFDKQGLIIDERFNSGGQIPDRFVELLNRPLYTYWGVRDGRDWQWPPVAHDGPKAMLINGWSGSGGDCFPLYFKQAGVGPLIGTRTWGGLIGISGAPDLIDGGGVTVPTFGIYSTEGEWIVEGYGVDPDIEVIDDPALMLDGGDPQLDRAIEEVMREIKSNPPQRPIRAPYPVKSGK
ncbi:MAG: peptidase S41, partial [bacterium]|nr:peptidase S41 [bacterium]